MKKTKCLTRSVLKNFVSNLTQKQCNDLRSLIDQARCDSIVEPKIFECDVVLTKHLIIDVAAATEEEAQSIIEAACFATECITRLPCGCSTSLDNVDQMMDEIEVVEVNVCE